MGRTRQTTRHGIPKRNSCWHCPEIVPAFILTLRSHRVYSDRMSRILISFLGQCHISGYPGVPADAAFPQVCRGILQAARPQHTIELVLVPYIHAGELPGVVRAALRQRPRVIVIEVVGWLAVNGVPVVDLSRFPRVLRTAYERTQYLRRTSRLVAERTRSSSVIHTVQTNAVSLANSVLRTLLPRLPRTTVPEYEACVSEALSIIQTHAGVTAVIQGPGAGNFAAASKGMPSDAVERYRAVNEMARRVADAHGALFVDRWDTVMAGFFLSGTTRPTVAGQSVWGHLLAETLLREGLV